MNTPWPVPLDRYMPVEGEYGFYRRPGSAGQISMIQLARMRELEEARKPLRDQPSQSLSAEDREWLDWLNEEYILCLEDRNAMERCIH